MKLVPVMFAHMCCGASAIAGQDANGDVYYWKLSWGTSRGWLAVPPPLGAATQRRGVSVTPGKVKPARPRRRR